MARLGLGRIALECQISVLFQLLRNIIASFGLAGSRLAAVPMANVAKRSWWLVLAIVSVFLLASMPAGAESPTVVGIKIDGNGTRTRVVAEVTADTGFSVLALPGPYRVVLEVPDVRFDLPSGIGRKKKGLVQQLRYGQSTKGQPQIVINTAGPVLIEKSYATGRSGKRKARIVVELVSTTPQVFAAVLARENAISNPTADAAAGDVTASLPLIMPRNTKPQAAGPLAEGQKRVIVIDPGHGGIDPGAVSPRKTREKDVVFAFALALKTALDGAGGYDVRLTRDNDTFLSLRDRVRIAREAQADLFIAIHADIVRGQTVTGTTLYTLSETASDSEAEALAQKENKADVIGGVDLGEQNEQVAGILIDLVQRESKNHAVLFSRAALDQLKGVTTMTGKPLRSAGFMVLRAPDVPSVLIELGYLSSANDEKKLLSPAWRKRMAEALARAISKHFSQAVAASSP